MESISARDWSREAEIESTSEAKRRIQDRLSGGIILRPASELSGFSS